VDRISSRPLFSRVPFRTRTCICVGDTGFQNGALFIKKSMTVFETESTRMDIDRVSVIGLCAEIQQMASSSLRIAFAIFGFCCAKKTVIDLATEREG